MVIVGMSLKGMQSKRFIETFASTRPIYINSIGIILEFAIRSNKSALHPIQNFRSWGGWRNCRSLNRSCSGGHVVGYGDSDGFRVGNDVVPLLIGTNGGWLDVPLASMIVMLLNLFVVFSDLARQLPLPQIPATAATATTTIATPTTKHARRIF